MYNIGQGKKVDAQIKSTYNLYWCTVHVNVCSDVDDIEQYAMLRKNQGKVLNIEHCLKQFSSTFCYAVEPTLFLNVNNMQQYYYAQISQQTSGHCN